MTTYEQNIMTNQNENYDSEFFRQNIRYRKFPFYDYNKFWQPRQHNDIGHVQESYSKKGISTCAKIIAGIASCLCCSAIIAVVLGLIPVYIGSSSSSSGEPALEEGSTNANVNSDLGQLGSNGRVISNCGTNFNSTLFDSQISSYVSNFTYKNNETIGQYFSIESNYSCVNNLVKWGIILKIVSDKYYFSNDYIKYVLQNIQNKASSVNSSLISNKKLQASSSIQFIVSGISYKYDKQTGLYDKWLLVECTVVDGNLINSNKCLFYQDQVLNKETFLTTTSSTTSTTTSKSSNTLKGSMNANLTSTLGKINVNARSIVLCLFGVVNSSSFDQNIVNFFSTYTDSSIGITISSYFSIQTQFICGLNFVEWVVTMFIVSNDFYFSNEYLKILLVNVQKEGLTLALPIPDAILVPSDTIDFTISGTAYILEIVTGLYVKQEIQGCSISNGSLKDSECVSNTTNIKDKATFAPISFTTGSTNACQNYLCGINAICQSDKGVPKCICPVGKQGNPNVQCCGLLTCACHGDPHCYSFDNATFHFQGICKYDLITTDCSNSELPKLLVPFNVKQKQEKRDTRDVSYIRYIEINVYNDQYRLVKKQKTETTVPFTINGIRRTAPYFDPVNKVIVSMAGDVLVFSTDFGLTIKWNGVSRAEETLCDSYSGHVCGLCGNADGNIPNDYVDRNNNSIELVGSEYSQYYKWGSTWIVEDDSADVNLTVCSNQTQTAPPDPTCQNSTLYNGTDWCGVLKQANGPFTNCINTFKSDELELFFTTCTFDMCALEGDSLQLSLKCSSFEFFVSRCYALSGGLVNVTNWRSQTNCPSPCTQNQVYEVRSGCPKTCLNPDGNYFCGLIQPIEGCYCLDGFVLDNDNNCVKNDSCGCLLPDKSSSINVGTNLTSLDCQVTYSCSAPLANVTIKTYKACSPNATCSVDQYQNPTCSCNTGFTGDGFSCISIESSTSTSTTSLASTSTSPSTSTASLVSTSSSSSTTSVVSTSISTSTTSLASTSTSPSTSIASLVSTSSSSSTTSVVSTSMSTSSLVSTSSLLTTSLSTFGSTITSTTSGMTVSSTSSMSFKSSQPTFFSNNTESIFTSFSENILSSQFSFSFSGEINTITYTSEIPIGQSCKCSESCPDLLCFNGTCMCSNNNTLSKSGECVPKLSKIGLDPCNKSSECSTNLCKPCYTYICSYCIFNDNCKQGFICDSETHSCICPEGQFWISALDSCFEKYASGADCYNNFECSSNICLSSGCSKGKCQ